MNTDLLGAIRNANVLLNTISDDSRVPPSLARQARAAAIALTKAETSANGPYPEETSNDEDRYWMNEDTGRVINADYPGRLWFEIDFETYRATTRSWPTRGGQ